MKLTAYRTTPGMDVQIRVAGRDRDWMDATNQRYAYRCLPLVIGNQCGWEILSSHDVQASWNGGGRLGDLVVAHAGGPPPYIGMSHFGGGVLTFSIPYLFRTPPGWQLMARGPTNCAKDGIAALDAIIETDWAISTFTMNWRFTRPGTVTFARGEPICLIMPVQSAPLEQFEAEFAAFDSNPELKQQFEAWSRSRREFNKDLKTPGSEAREAGWQKDYVQQAERSKLKLRPFRESGDSA